MSNQKTIGIDIGNSAIKTAEFFDTRIGEVAKWANLNSIIGKFGQAQFIVSSVGISTNEITAKLKNALILNSETPLPISINYQTPKTLGSDRIAAAVGAWNQFPKTNILIIDAGTCMTYDLVTADGVFQGGMISPGLDMRLKAMHRFTNGLPLVDQSDDFDADIVGKSTNECIWLGAKRGLDFEIQGILDFFNKKHDRLQVVITGGLPIGFESITKPHIFANSKIVLRGLHAIWKIQ